MPKRLTQEELDKLEHEITLADCEIHRCPACNDETEQARDKIEYGLLEADESPSRTNTCGVCGLSWVEYYCWGGINCLEYTSEEEDNAGREDDCLQHHYPEEDLTEGGL